MLWKGVEVKFSGIGWSAVSNTTWYLVSYGTGACIFWSRQFTRNTPQIGTRYSGSIFCLGMYVCAVRRDLPSCRKNCNQKCLVGRLLARLVLPEPRNYTVSGKSTIEQQHQQQQQHKDKQTGGNSRRCTTHICVSSSLLRHKRTMPFE